VASSWLSRRLRPFLVCGVALGCSTSGASHRAAATTVPLLKIVEHSGGPLSAERSIAVFPSGVLKLSSELYRDSVRITDAQYEEVSFRVSLISAGDCLIALRGAEAERETSEWVDVGWYEISWPGYSFSAEAGSLPLCAEQLVSWLEGFCSHAFPRTYGAGRW
jgi:hypothetical protein